MSMEMNKALDLLREIRPSIPKEVLELWCKDRDAFLASHPAVEQAGGDERAACNLWIAEQQLCQGSDISLFKLERNGALVSLHDLLRDAYQAGQARAALAQPSPKSGDYSDQSWINAGCPPEQPEQAEAERPEVVARVVHSNPVVLGQCSPLNANDELMTVAQHAASVARWAEMFNRVEQQRDAALARVAELEKQEPVATVAKVPGEDWNSLDFHRDLQDMQPGTKLYAAPVAQAQQLHDLDKQCRDDVARALGLRPNQERGFAWSYLLASIKSCVKASGDSAQAQHSVPKEFIGRLSEFLAQRGATGKALLRELRAMLAAAPAQGGE